MNYRNGEKHNELSECAGGGGVEGFCSFLSPAAGSRVGKRQNERWSEAETQHLIASVKEHGKGKWRHILELGSNIFRKRLPASPSFLLFV